MSSHMPRKGHPRPRSPSQPTIDSLFAANRSRPAAYPSSRPVKPAIYTSTSHQAHRRQADHDPIHVPRHSNVSMNADMRQRSWTPAAQNGRTNVSTTARESPSSRGASFPRWPQQQQEIQDWDRMKTSAASSRRDQSRDGVGLNRTVKNSNWSAQQPPSSSRHEQYNTQDGFRRDTARSEQGATYHAREGESARAVPGGATLPARDRAQSFHSDYSFGEDDLDEASLAVMDDLESKGKLPIVLLSSALTSAILLSPLQSTTHLARPIPVRASAKPFKAPTIAPLDPVRNRQISPPQQRDLPQQARCPPQQRRDAAQQSRVPLTQQRDPPRQPQSSLLHKSRDASSQGTNPPQQRPKYAYDEAAAKRRRLAVCGDLAALKVASEPETISKTASGNISVPNLAPPPWKPSSEKQAAVLASLDDDIIPRAMLEGRKALPVKEERNTAQSSSYSRRQDPTKDIKPDFNKQQTTAVARPEDGRTIKPEEKPGRLATKKPAPVIDSKPPMIKPLVFRGLSPSPSPTPSSPTASSPIEPSSTIRYPAMPPPMLSPKPSPKRAFEPMSSPAELPARAEIPISHEPRNDIKLERPVSPETPKGDVDTPDVEAEISHLHLQPRPKKKEVIILSSPRSSSSFHLPPDALVDIPRPYSSSFFSVSPSTEAPTCKAIKRKSSNGKTPARKRRCKSQMAVREDGPEPDLKTSTSPSTLINGRLYDDRQLASWRKEGWLGPRDESSRVGKPRWCAYNGYDETSVLRSRSPSPSASPPPIVQREPTPIAPSPPPIVFPELPPFWGVVGAAAAQVSLPPADVPRAIFILTAMHFRTLIDTDSRTLTLPGSSTFGHLLHSLAIDPRVSTQALRIDHAKLALLSHVTTVHLDRLPNLAEVGAIQALVSSTPKGRLLPSVTRLRLSWSAQNRLTEEMYRSHEDGTYKIFLRALASIADIEELETDYNFRALDSIPLQHGMEVLRAAWPKLKLHRIRHGLDDLPYTMPGILHETTYTLSSYPFKNGPEVLNYCPEDIEDNFEVDQTLAKWIKKLGDKDRVEKDRAEEMRWKQQANENRLRAFKKREEKAQRNALMVNAYTPWFLNIARVIVTDYLRSPQAATHFKIHCPQLPPGLERGNFDKGKTEMREEIKSRLRSEVESGLEIEINLEDPRQLDGWIQERLQLIAYKPSML